MNKKSEPMPTTTKRKKRVMDLRHLPGRTAVVAHWIYGEREREWERESKESLVLRQCTPRDQLHRHRLSTRHQRLLPPPALRTRAQLLLTVHGQCVWPIAPLHILSYISLILFLSFRTTESEWISCEKKTVRYTLFFFCCLLATKCSFYLFGRK